MSEDPQRPGKTAYTGVALLLALGIVIAFTLAINHRSAYAGASAVLVGFTALFAAFAAIAGPVVALIFGSRLAQRAEIGDRGAALAGIAAATGALIAAYLLIGWIPRLYPNYF